MSEAQGALGGAVFDGSVRVSETGLRGMVMLRADIGATKVRTAVKAAVGVAVPGARRMAWDGGRGALWMSPDELLLMVSHAEAGAVVAGLSEALTGVHHLAADVSDARAVFRLTGDLALAREVLAKLTPADVSPEGFGPGEVRRTRLGQVAAAFWIDEDGVTVVCFRSVARYVFELLSDAAAPGSEVGFWS